MTQIPEEFIALVQVLADDEDLKRWFVSLAALPANRRYSELGRMSLQLRDAGQEVLSRVILSLNNEHIYLSIREVVAVVR